MKTFLLILFFGRSILLTPEPIDLNQSWIELTPIKPISAITGGGSLRVDVTQATGYIPVTGGLDKIIPVGTVVAELIPESGPPLIVANHASGHSKDNVFLILSRENGGMPTDIKFKKVRIRSLKPLHQVKVQWANCSL